MSNPGNIIGGHKANLHNENTSEESKQHSKEVLQNEFNVSSEGKNLNNVAGGFKSALNNPNVSDEAKQSAEERLADLK